MAAAIEAGESARGRTSPNPWVGAALVHNGRIVSRGATSPPGGPHAEAGALGGEDVPEGSVLYVTLEPCAAFEGKRTAPCANLIIERGVAKVVVAIEDPDPRVRGHGIAQLRAAGIPVEIGDGQEAVLQSLRPYMKHRQTGLPYVIAKFAASLDGRIAANGGDSKWITGEPARERVHAARAHVDAILAGSGTVLADDPALTARPGGAESDQQPVRVVLDSRGRIPPASQVLHRPGRSIVATAHESSPEWKEAIRATGATVLECEHDDTGIRLEQLLRTLGQRGVMTAWVEGGSSLLGSLFDTERVDEVWAFLAPRIIGGEGRPAVGGYGIDRIAQAHQLRDVVAEQVGEDILVRGYTGNWEPSDRV